MSVRTADADKAIRIAWENEHKLVSDGQGTRDWTPEQQRDILEYGKAYDDEGKAFHGQHMKSVAQYPNYQGDPRNIQFLTKDEHFEAHKGSWQNPTNWYYDPVNKQFIDFGDGAPIPCAVIELSDPVILVDKCNTDEVADEAAQTEEKPSSGTDPPTQNTQQTINSGALDHDNASNVQIKHASSRNAFSRLVSWGGETAKHLWHNYKGEIITFALSLVAVALDAVTSSSNNSDDDASSISDSNAQSSRSTKVPNVDSVIRNDYFEPSESPESFNEEEIMKEKRKSPKEHTVNDPGQRYHYKDGSVRYKEKQPYKRGTPKGEE